MNNIVDEGLAKLRIAVPKVVSKSMPQFYNPVMATNRWINIILLRALDRKGLQVALPLSGTGIRGIRFLKELPKSMFKSIAFNDHNPKFKKSLKQTFKLNKISISKKISITSDDANLFLLNSKGFDYIDIDPFGSPNMFLDSAIRRIARDGILAVTTTDTSALTGAFRNACRRKYWAEPLHTFLMHEFAARILGRKVQLIGAQYDKAMIPVFTHSTDHYIRIYFECHKGKKKVDEMLKLHKMYEQKGPIWTGQLWDKKLAANMNELVHVKSEFHRLINTIHQESRLEFPFFHDIHKLCKKHRFMIPGYDSILKTIKKKKHKACRTHFSDKGLKSTITEKELVKILESLQN